MYGDVGNDMRERELLGYCYDCDCDLVWFGRVGVERSLLQEIQINKSCKILLIIIIDK